MSGPVTPGRRNDDYDQAQQQVPANGPAHAVGLEVRLGPVFLLDRGAKVLVWGVIKVPEDQYHGDAEHLHDVHVKACLREPAEPGEEHPVACDQEQRDRPPDPGEVPAEHLGEEAEALGRLNADGGGAQDQKDKEEPADPDQRGKYVKRGGDDHFGSAKLRRTHLTLPHGTVKTGRRANRTYSAAQWHSRSDLRD